MKKKFKVVNDSPFGVSYSKGFYTFEEAKAKLRKRIVCPEAVGKITDHIYKYAKEHYPKDTPIAFKQLADIFTNLATDPEFPKSIEDVVLEDFEDENIEFYMDDYTKSICSYVNNDEYDGKFPIFEINVIKMDDPTQEYYFFFTEKKDCLCYSLNYSLSPIAKGEKVFEYDDSCEDDCDEDE